MKQDYINLEDININNVKPSNLITNSGKRYIIEQVLDNLNENEKIIIEMIYYEGLSYRECSEILGINIRNFKRKVKKIFLKMKQIFYQMFPNFKFYGGYDGD